MPATNDSLPHAVGTREFGGGTGHARNGSYRSEPQHTSGFACVTLRQPSRGRHADKRTLPPPRDGSPSPAVELLARRHDVCTTCSPESTTRKGSSHVRPFIVARARSADSYQRADDSRPRHEVVSAGGCVDGDGRQSLDGDQHPDATFPNPALRILPSTPTDHCCEACSHLPRTTTNQSFSTVITRSSIDFFYDDLDDDTLGRHRARAFSCTAARRTATFVSTRESGSGGAYRDWFIDTTPGNNSEFNFNSAQLLWRDLTVAQQNDWFNHHGPDTPETFEVSYFGDAWTGTDADGRHDMLSVVMHEVGHALGMSARNQFHRGRNRRRRRLRLQFGIRLRPDAGRRNGRRRRRPQYQYCPPRRQQRA